MSDAQSDGNQNWRSDRQKWRERVAVAKQNYYNALADILSNWSVRNKGKLNDSVLALNDALSVQKVDSWRQIVKELNKKSLPAWAKLLSESMEFDSCFKRLKALSPFARSEITVIDHSLARKFFLAGYLKKEFVKVSSHGVGAEFTPSALVVSTRKRPFSKVIVIP